MSYEFKHSDQRCWLVLKKSENYAEGLSPPPSTQQVASALGGLSHIVLERARSDRYTVTMSDGPAIRRPRDPLGAISCLWAVKSPASPAGLICAACMLLHTCLLDVRARGATVIDVCECAEVHSCVHRTDHSPRLCSVVVYFRVMM